jgi:hypothetical protein
LIAVGLATAGCGSASGPSLPTIGAARQYELTKFEPAATVEPGRPNDVAFTIQLPSGKPLTTYRRGPGPHTGVHLIIVRNDLSVIIHQHPPVGPDGHVVEPIVFPKPGPYRVLVDAYPKLKNGPPNFQLHREVRVAGAYRPQPLGAYSPTVTVDGYRFTVHGRPNLHALQGGSMLVTVTDPSGKPASFTPWFGALGHAIFFRAGSLDYLHTHICGPNTPACLSAVGGVRVVGHSTRPGRLLVGTLFTAPGKWRLFLQCKVGGRVLTVPFTLRVR